MSSMYVKLIPLVVSCSLLILAFRVHERFWSLGFSGWKKIYLGLVAIVLGSLGGIFFEFSELKNWQEALGWPVDWVILSVFASLGASFILWGSVERLALAAREKDDLDLRREAYELFDSIRDAAQGPYSFLEILNYSLKEIMRKVDADAGAIWLLHPSGGDYILASASGFALPLQQKLERVKVAHAGFSRLVESGTAREITDPKALRYWFPEFQSPETSYASLIGVPLVGRYDQAQRREPLGLLLLCSREKVCLGPADTKLIGSAVTFLAGTIAEAKAHRVSRSQQRAYDRLRAQEEEFSTWIKAWSTNGKARQRLQAAISGLAEHAGDFVGCGKYIPDEDRWEPLALASAMTEKNLLGRKDFRRAAAEAVRTGRESIFELSPADREGGNATGYRMAPVPNPQEPERTAAILFLPIVADAPPWWNRAVGVLTELARVVLALEDIPTKKMPIGLSLDVGPPFDWAALGQLADRGMRGKPDDLPPVLAELLPEGWRMALWQATSDRAAEYRLRLAAGKDCPSKYFSTSELSTAPPADQSETNAHLGGLVRIQFPDAGTLTDLWPDFGRGWFGERFPAVWESKSWGWITFYQQADHPEPDGRQLSFLRGLAGLTELIISHHDASVPGQTAGSPNDSPAESEGGEQEKHQPAPLEIPDAPVPLDRAITQWFAAGPVNVRLGRLEFDTPLTSTLLVSGRTVGEILTWGVGNLQNGLPESEYVAVEVQKRGKQVSIIFARSDPPRGDLSSTSTPPAQVLPVVDSVRKAFQSWNAQSRIFNSRSGPRKLILDFYPMESGNPHDTAVGNVLVVDDQELIRDLLLGMLEVLGYRAAAARSAEDGLSRFSAEDFDTVITGQNRRSDAAIELAKQIKQRRPNTRVILVEEPGLADADHSSSPWIDGIIAKPFRIDELRVVLEVSSVTEVS